MDLGKKYNLDRQAIIIGRSSKADIQIDQESVSRNHCKLINTGKTIMRRFDHVLGLLGDEAALALRGIDVLAALPTPQSCRRAAGAANEIEDTEAGRALEDAALFLAAGRPDRGKQVVDETVASLEEPVVPELLARARQLSGDADLALGEFDAAVGAYQQALLAAAAADDSLSQAVLLAELAVAEGLARHDAGRSDGHASHALALVQSGSFARNDAIRIQVRVATYYDVRGDGARALELIEGALRLLGDGADEAPYDRVVRAGVLVDYAMLLQNERGDWQSSLRAARESVRLREELYGKEHPTVADALGVMVLRRGGPEQRLYGWMLVGNLVAALLALLSSDPDRYDPVSELLGAVAIGACVFLVMIPPVLRSLAGRLYRSNRLGLAKRVVDLRELLQPGMSLEYIRLADEQGLGNGRRENIEVVGTPELADERWGFSVGDNGASMTIVSVVVAREY